VEVAVGDVNVSAIKE